MHKDIFGNILSVGDIVAFNHPNYKDMTTGTIIKITTKCVTIEYVSFRKIIETSSEYPRNTVKKIINER